MNMKTVMNTVKTGIVTRLSSVRNRLQQAKAVLADNTGEGYVDSGVKILIAVVIGALLLAGLYALFNTTIMPTVTQKVTDLFSYSGS